MNDIYSAPTATLNEAPTGGGNYGSLERGIAGDYHFAIGETISEAWAKTKGFKWKVHLALGLYLLVYIPVALLTNFLVSTESPAAAVGGAVLQFLIITAVINPIMAGLLVMGIKRAVDVPVASTSVFSYYGKIVPLLITSLLSTLLIMIGFVLLILPGIYLSIAYYLAIPLVAEKGLSPWQAMEASRKAISKRWFAVFGLMLVLMLINVATVITLGIGMIWTIPLSLIALGVLYRNIFGCTAETLAG